MAKKAQSPLKNKPLRYPGQSLDEEIQNLIDDKIVSSYWFAAVFVLIAILEWAAYLGKWPRQPGAFTVVALIAVAYCVWQFPKVRKRTRALRLGRDGERLVGQFLEGLRTHGARIFHDVPGTEFNLDHVVIAPQGVFVIETKTIAKPYPKAKVTITGEQLFLADRKMERDPVQQVRAQVSWLTQILEESTGRRLPVRGAVVFPGWFVEPPPSGSSLGLWVLEPKAIPAFIEREPERLSLSDVSLVAFHLSRYIQASEKPTR